MVTLTKTLPFIVALLSGNVANDGAKVSLGKTTPSPPFIEVNFPLKADPVCSTYLLYAIYSQMSTHRIPLVLRSEYTPSLY
jgi:hypothetical protein